MRNNPRNAFTGLLRSLLFLCPLLSGVDSTAWAGEKQLLWGDTHLHTSYSFDAFLNNNLTADPDTAYRWAKGLPVVHPYNRTRVQLQTPLDFLVVADHAELLGALPDIYYNGISQADAGIVDQVLNWYTTRTIRNAIDAEDGQTLFAGALPVSEDPRQAAASWGEVVGRAFSVSDNVVAQTWARSTKISDSHYVPGEFTTFIGWEWSSTPGGANLHRVVFTTADADVARSFLPFGSTDSPYPEDLWRWVEETQQDTGAAFMVIPHNSNISKGMMFADKTLRGEAFTPEYAALRGKWERVVEVTQIKGDSETHPDLSPDDAFADFELYPFYIQQTPAPYQPQKGDYIRSALKTGLSLGRSLGVNPFRFGLIGSTDAHTGLSSAEEPNFWGKMATDSIPENKASKMISGGPTGWTMSAQGLAAVWAEENTRESIMAAFKRREVYATTGPRIRVQVFAGSDFTEDDLLAENLAAVGAAKGVPMGSDLEADGSPAFLVFAEKDPNGANLDRIQMIKGWVDADGVEHEKVHDIVWSAGRELGADGEPADVGDTVDRATGRYTNTIGAAQLATVWSDTQFDPTLPAFYYVRVLQIPTPRHALLDALALGMRTPTEGKPVLRERAYTSPIWYQPQ
ncbi:MAG: DUF3604 domain-containing protein [Pseudomonadales bacterium]